MGCGSCCCLRNGQGGVGGGVRRKALAAFLIWDVPSAIHRIGEKFPVPHRSRVCCQSCVGGIYQISVMVDILDLFLMAKKILTPVFQQPDHLQDWFWWQNNHLIPYCELNFNLRHGSHLEFFIVNYQLCSAVSHHPDNLEVNFWLQTHYILGANFYFRHVSHFGFQKIAIFNSCLASR